MSDITKPSGEINYKSTYVCGIDLNRRGNDETAIVVIEQLPFSDVNSPIFVSMVETKNTKSLVDVIGRVQYLHTLFNFKKIFIDTTGLGSGVTDVLKEKIRGGIVEEVMFTSRSKPEMFINLQLLLQRKRLKIPNYTKNNDENSRKLFFQLLSIDQEYRSDSNIPLITHQEKTHDDVVCALAMACLYYKNKQSKTYLLSNNYIVNN